MIPLVVALFVVVVLYWVWVRRLFGRWGTTAADRARVMPGDAMVTAPTYSATLAVLVNARPEQIWPWLLQIGYGRGGLYSYDWLDRLFGFLDRPSATRILPEFQRLQVGDVIPIGRGPWFPVAGIETNRTLILGGKADGFVWVWQLGLHPLDNGRTRLVSRNTACVPKSVGAWLFMAMLEPAAFLMTRRMLIGIKQRAETLSSEQHRRSLHAA